MKHSLLIIFLFFFCSCKEQKKNVPFQAFTVESDSLRTLPIVLTDTVFAHMDNLLHETRHIALSNKVLLGVTKRVLIEEDMIFILDNTPKIVCFNLQDGSVKYQINNMGGGPEEFGNVLDFTIDKVSKQLITYDNSKRRLARYDLFSGKFLFASSTKHIAPFNIASIDGVFFFDNPDHYNYPNDKEMHYSLLYTTKDTEIESRYFPHDEVADYAFHFGEGHPFFYNQDKILYNKRFENIIYQLTFNSIKALYKIDLPNQLPIDLIKDKIQPIELSNSDYSWGISRIYECDEILYFWFSKNRFYQTVFYDLKNDKLIYGGRTAFNIPSRLLSVYYPIDGVYKEQFFSLASPLTVIEKREKTSMTLFSDDLMNVKEDDNPIVFFYKPVR